MSLVHAHRSGETLLGSVSLIVGFGLIIVVVAVRLEGLWELPAGLIRRNPVLVLGLSVCLILSGSRLLWLNRNHATGWKPTVSGRRFQQVVLVSKSDCPLCEDARHLLSAYQPFLPPIQTVNVADDPELESRYARCVPVVEIDGRKRFVGPPNEILLRRLIEGTPPCTR